MLRLGKGTNVDNKPIQYAEGKDGERIILDLELAIDEVYHAANNLYTLKLIDRKQSMKFDSLITHLDDLLQISKNKYNLNK